MMSIDNVLNIFATKHPELVVERIFSISGNRYLIEAPSKVNRDEGISNMYLYADGAPDAAVLNPSDDIDEFIAITSSAKKMWPSDEILHAAVWRWK